MIKFTGDQEDQHKFSIDSQQKVDQDTEALDLEKWRETAWYLMGLQDS